MIYRTEVIPTTVTSYIGAVNRILQKSGKKYFKMLMCWICLHTQ